MKTRLLLLSVAALGSLIAVSAWATSHVGIQDAVGTLIAAPDIGSHPWFIATLFDAYFGFLWFWVWIAYKEDSNLARAAWLLAVLALGNMAMSAYMLIQLARLPPDPTAADLLLRRA